MADVRGSQTEKNLLKSFAGESQARNRYTFAASVAKKEGLVQISNIFTETADNELEHAKRMFKYLAGGNALEIQAAYPAGKIGTTLENLLASAAGEEEEHTILYPEFAATARKEGFEEVARMYEAISVAEKQHGKRYRALAANVTNKKVFEKDGVVKWRCNNCGYVHEGKSAPTACTACLHPQAHFEVLAENW